MIKDFSDKKLQELKKYIQEINDSEFSIISDELGDLIYTFESWVGILNIQNYLDNVETYHKKVLDQHDTSISKVEKIFRNVRGIDATYELKINRINNSIEKYVKCIKSLKDTIDPAEANFHINNIKTMSKEISNDVTDADKLVNEIYDDVLSELQKDVLKEAGKDIGKDLINIATNICSLTINLIERDTLGTIDDVWSLIDDVVNTGSDLAALATIPIGMLIAGISGDKSVKTEAIKKAKQLYKTDGMAGHVENEYGSDAEITKVFKGADTIADTAGLIGTSKSFVKSAGTMSKIVGNESLTAGTKIHIILDEVNPTGFSKMDYDTGTYLGELKNAKGLFKNIKYVGDMAEATYEGDLNSLEEIILSKRGIFSIGKSGYEITENIMEIVFVN